MMYKLWIGMLLALLVWSCEAPAPASDDALLRIVATTGMVADMVKNVGGDSVQVSTLMGPGVDPHLYKATQGDLRKLQEADIIFYNGLRLEGKMGEIFEKLGQLKTVVPLAQGIDSTQLMADPVYQDAYDPHIWFNVGLWATTADQVAQTLAAVDSDNRRYYRDNAEAYQAELQQLHRWVAGEIQKIPAEHRILITAHDAFNYFGEAYGIEVRGLQGISTLSEFGLKDRVDFVDLIVERQIKAVFVETSVSEKNIQAIVEACRQKGHEVAIGGKLYSDAMGAPGSDAGDYPGMVRANVRTIVDALL